MGEVQTQHVERLVQESLGYMTRIHQLRGKIQSALAIIEGPAFGEYDGDMDDARLILHSALHTDAPTDPQLTPHGSV